MQVLLRVLFGFFATAMRPINAGRCGMHRHTSNIDLHGPMTLVLMRS